MSIQLLFTTILGGFLLPFFIVMFWDKLVSKLGIFGGWVAALFIVGTIWSIDHGFENSLIHQTGKVWIDMAWSAAIGVFSASVVSGGKIKKSVFTLLAAIIGGVSGGIILYLYIM